MRILSIAIISTCIAVLTNGSPIESGLAIRGGKHDRSDWSYADPAAWPRLFKSCGGYRQSPININSTSTIKAGRSPLRFINYDTIQPEVITVFDHNVVFTFPSSGMRDRAYITDVPHGDKYIFHSMHFHWGSDSSRGSEHQIDSKRFPGELHMVHYNSKYRSLEEAKAEKDGLAVLAVFIQVSRYDNTELQPIIDQFKSVSRRQIRSRLSHPISLYYLLPGDTSQFYRYSGSLTTPKCDEVVTWTVFPMPINLSEYQLSVMRKVTADNFRLPQPLYGRQIKFYY